jgi:integrator complex subunit 11
MVDRKGDTEFYTAEEIQACMRRVTPVQLHETIVIGDGIEVTPYYAGHVLGACP